MRRPLRRSVAGIHPWERLARQELRPPRRWEGRGGGGVSLVILSASLNNHQRGGVPQKTSHPYGS